MKKIDLYQCDICGTQFSDKKLCEKCERGHVTDILIRFDFEGEGGGGR